MVYSYLISVFFFTCLLIIGQFDIDAGRKYPVVETHIICSQYPQGIDESIIIKYGSFLYL